MVIYNNENACMPNILETGQYLVGKQLNEKKKHDLGRFSWWKLAFRRPPRERKIRGSIAACAVGIFLEKVIPVTLKLMLQSLPCRAPGVIGSALGLVDPVSVYCSRVR